MPQVFKIGPYVIFFWIGEGNPLEPVHVHIAEKIPAANSTKVWITRSKKALLANNNSKIPETMLHKLMRMIEANVDEILKQWNDYFGVTDFYC